MSGGGGGNSVAGTFGLSKVTAAAASATLLVFALAGCVPSPASTAPTPTATPTSTATIDPTPLPTIEPLIVPGCETLLPLSTAKSLFSTRTEILDEQDSAANDNFDVAELDTVAANATIAKNCAWGVPNSDGYFRLIVADIDTTDAAALTAALTSFGYLGVTAGGVTSLELATENEVGTRARAHYLVGDLWIFVDGTSLSLTTSVADNALDQIRTANPTRTY